jgi:chemotaxis protein CheX
MLVASSDILALTENVWASMLELEVVPATEAESLLVGDDCVAGSVSIRGDWNGLVSVALAPDLARLVTSKMFELDIEEADDEMCADAVGEIANMLGGGFKAILSGEDNKLGLPEVEWLFESWPEGHDLEARVICVSEGGALVVSVYELLDPEA